MLYITVIPNHVLNTATVIGSTGSGRGAVLIDDYFFSFASRYDWFENYGIQRRHISDIEMVIKGDKQVSSKCNNQYMQDAILAKRVAQFAYEYCKQIANTPAMKQTLIEACKASKDFRLAYDYCNQVENDNEVRQVIINSKNAYLAQSYCINVSNDADMKEVIIKYGNAELALVYGIVFGDDERLRQVIIESKDAKIAAQYCKKVTECPKLKAMTG